MPVNKDDFDEPDWEKILTLAFPEWERPKAGCPRLDSLSGNITEGFTEFPVYEEGKWNPCYYTKAFAGLGELYSDKMCFKSVHKMCIKLFLCFIYIILIH